MTSRVQPWASATLGLVLAVVTGGCVERGTSLRLTIDGTPGMALSSIDLRIALDGKLGPIQRLGDGTPPVLPGTVVAKLPDEPMELIVSVSAITTAGPTVSARATTRSVSKQEVRLTVFLDGPIDPGAGPTDGGVLADGSPCTSGAACASGSCVDGVCCDATCAGGCGVCSVAAGAKADGTCSPRAAGALCRDAIGTCDVAERCDGNAFDCPADVQACPPSTYCTGSTCATKRAQGAACSTAVECASGFCVDGVCCDKDCSAGPCDACSTLLGATTDGACKLLGASTICRGAASGGCDVAEACNGSLGTCPPDQLLPMGTTCRASAGVCDVAETCTGTSAACPANAFVGGGTLCRGILSACDRAEFCSGGAPDCPADDVAPTISPPPYLTSFGHAAFSWDGGSLGAQYLENACNDNSFARSFFEFDTDALPDGAVILSASLGLCVISAGGGGGTKLYSATFSPGVDNGDWDAPISFLLDIPGGVFTPITMSPPVSSVRTVGWTQYAIRHSLTSCTGGNWIRYASGGTETFCAVAGPQLTITYCVP